MKLSMRWLREYVGLDAKPRAFAHAMTMSGSKVEGYETEGGEIHNVVIGRVLEITPHEDSDHLVVCRVDAGREAPLQIVTGAANVTVGSLVPVALDGSSLPGGKRIRSGKLRGVASEGMLCSLGELGLTAHDFPYAIEDGIFLIEEDCRVGQDIREAIGLNDTTVEFEITSNRPDCLSILGLAREAAATYRLPFHPPAPQVAGSGGDIHATVKSVEVQNPELCPRYTCKVIQNVRVAPSPRWMRERLRACGVRPINNLVDITNYVLLEYGQPLHAFDARFLSGGQIRVRTALPGESIQTLDGTERPLNERMLVIADRDRPVAVAGVMGGANSCVLDDTRTVVLESANFLGRSVRSTSRTLSLRTDASSRYEKGLDPQNTLPALLRACELVELLDAGEVVDGIIDVNDSPAALSCVPFDPSWINRFLGIELSGEEMAEILRRLGFRVEGGQVAVPSFRADVRQKADLAEEVARLYGYDKIPSTAIRGVAKAQLTDQQKCEREIHSVLRACGCYEISTYSFISPKYYDNIRLPADSPLRDCVTITNPLGEDTSVMRTTMLPSLLEVLSRNYNNRNETFACYEIGSEYRKTAKDTLPDENAVVVFGMYGEGYDFYRLKGVAEALLNRLHIRDWEIRPVTDHPTFHPGRCAEITKNGVWLGLLGEAHPAVLETYSIGTKACLASFCLAEMFDCAHRNLQYKPLPKFPAATRDLSLLCDRELPIAEIEKAIRTGAGRSLEAVKLFDVYQGPQISGEKKSVSYSLTLRSPDSTLTDAEADAVIHRALKVLEKINVHLREK